MSDELASEKEQKDFYHKSALESKKQKKLLKIALNRLESECDILKDKYNIAEKDLLFTKHL